MTKTQLKSLELRARKKINDNLLAGIFRKIDCESNGYDLNGELIMTGTNDEIMSFLNLKALIGIYEEVGEYIVVTTHRYQYIGKLIPINV